MVNKGVDVNSKAFYTKRTALMLAAEKGDETIVRILLDKGADVKARDFWENTPLVYAVWGGNEVVVQALIAKGADVNARNVASWTPVMLGVMHGHNGVVKTLLENGADVNAKRPWPGGQTALQLAVHYNNTELIQLFLDAGAKE